MFKFTGCKIEVKIFSLSKTFLICKYGTEDHGFGEALSLLLLNVAEVLPFGIRQRCGSDPSCGAR